MLQASRVRCAFHYVHPKTGKPLRQSRTYGDPRYINNEVALITGQWGLITADFGMITLPQLENARLALLRRLERGTFTLHMHTDYEEVPIVRKNPEARRGGGKNQIHHFAFKLTTCVPLFELEANTTTRLTRAEAEHLFIPARVLLPLETVVVPQGRVDEYSILK